MPEYIVKRTDILHNKKLYPENSSIELTEVEAKVLADYLELMPELKKQPPKAVKESQKKPNTPKTTEEQEPDGGEN